MSSVGFGPTISVGERSQTHALDRAATGTSNQGITVWYTAFGMWWHTVTQGGEVKGKLASGVGSQYSYTTSERGVSSITNADAHTSAASSRLN